MRTLLIPALVPVLLGACVVFGCGVRPGFAAPERQDKPARGPRKIVASKGTTNFTSKVAQFSIYFPVKPTQTKKSLSADVGKYEQFVFQSKTGTASYIVMATTIPRGPEKAPPAAENVEWIRRGFEKARAGSKVLKSQKVTLDGTPGHHIIRSTEHGAVLDRVHIYCGAKIAYCVMAVTTGKQHQSPSEFQAQSKQVDKFLNSFRLLAK